MEGYIKLYRSLLDWGWYSDNNTKAVFLHLLLTANFKDGQFRGRIIRRGQCVTSIPQLEKELHLTARQVRTALQHLKKTGELFLESTNRYTVATIQNYDRYQQAEASPRPDNGQADGGRTTPSEEGEKESRKESQKERFPALVRDLYTVCCPSFPPCRSLSPQRIRDIQTCFDHGLTLQDFEEGFRMAQQSPFLRGENPRGWTAGFGWMVREENLTRILEGAYKPRPEGDQPSYDLEELARRGLQVPEFPHMMGESTSPILPEQPGSPTPGKEVIG